ncbi:hypothetical protein F5B22DRAFT_8837 [Xylaria bambusicola]|uniref:uncharacterized protein n=1 Tax=Xylaria bambusicola TaxID=326684 RepID=UPI0020074998|nr:uncharacterized protein F5B22DRAFT_8837 [Xylaria bambusicola]KAI0527881.1 hypothetical protein F5B22DRAFT_8837 [Xylaria bambusicola]
MCTTVIFQYKCGCAERVVFECPFSSTTTQSSTSSLSSSPSESLRAHAHRNCSRRYQLQQQKLFASKGTTKPSTILSSHQTQSQMQTGIPVLPFPKPSCLQIGKPEEQRIAVTELDELCHDCWQLELQLTKQRESNDSDTMETDGDEQEDSGMNARVLREMFLNELVVPPQNANLGATSSAESFPEIEQASQQDVPLEERY